MWIYHILFIHSSADGHSGYYHVLAAVNNVAMHVVIWYLFESLLLIPLGIYLEVGLLDHVVIYI